MLNIAFHQLVINHKSQKRQKNSLTDMKKEVLSFWWRGLKARKKFMNKDRLYGLNRK